MKEDAKAAAVRWLADFGLPADPGEGKDLAGRVIRVCSFLHDQDLQFFFPRRTIPFQNRMVKEVTARLRSRGASIGRVLLTAHDYARWLDAQEEKTDSPARRYQFATRPPAD